MQSQHGVQHQSCRSLGQALTQACVSLSLPQSEATEIKPSSKCWVTYLGNPGLCLDMVLHSPGEVSPTFLRLMSSGVMWPPEAEEAPSVWALPHGQPPQPKGNRLCGAHPCFGCRSRIHVTAFNGTCVPGNSGNCGSLPTQGDGIDGTARTSVTDTCSSGVAVASL